MVQDLYGLCPESAVMWVLEFNSLLVGSYLKSSTCLFTIKKVKKTTLANSRVAIVSETYFMYIPRITVVGEDAADTTSIM